MGHIEKYEALLQKFAEWAETQDDIRAVFILGSRTRTYTPADKWSDLDIAVITTRTDRYLNTTDWLENVGGYWLTFIESALTGDEERRVLFKSGLDVDFAIVDKAKILKLNESEDAMKEAAGVLHRGYEILFDKDDILANFYFKPIKQLTKEPPSEKEFDNVINDFLYHGVLTAKKLKRGEIWYAKACLDSYMKRLMQRMIEWHSGAKSNWIKDTWHDGRFMEKWANPEILKKLKEAYAYYDENDIWRALEKSMNLFNDMATETAEILDYAYPHEGDMMANTLINQIRSGEF